MKKMMLFMLGMLMVEGLQGSSEAKQTALAGQLATTFKSHSSLKDNMNWIVKNPLELLMIDNFNSKYLPDFLNLFKDDSSLAAAHLCAITSWPQTLPQVLTASGYLKSNQTIASVSLEDNKVLGRFVTILQDEKLEKTFLASTEQDLWKNITTALFDTVVGFKQSAHILPLLNEDALQFLHKAMVKRLKELKTLAEKKS